MVHQFRASNEDIALVLHLHEEDPTLPDSFTVCDLSLSRTLTLSVARVKNVRPTAVHDAPIPSDDRGAPRAPDEGLAVAAGPADDLVVAARPGPGSMGADSPSLPAPGPSPPEGAAQARPSKSKGKRKRRTGPRQPKWKEETFECETLIESRKKNRRSRTLTGKWNQPSASHYVGYVEDGESVAAIMAKFAAMEDIKAKTIPAPSEKEEGTEAAPPAEDEQMTVEQLEEVYKMTAHQPISLLANNQAIHGNESEDVLEDVIKDVIEISSGSGSDWFDEEWDGHDDGDEVLSSGEGSDWYEREAAGRRRGCTKKRVTREHDNKLRALERAYTLGRRFHFKKQSKTSDRHAPVYTRIPPHPMPSSWAKTVAAFEDLSLADPVPASTIRTENMKIFDICSLGEKRFLAVLLDPPLHCAGMPARPGALTTEEFRDLRLHRLLDNGFMFVWLEKLLIPEMLDVMSSWGLTYVENVCWVRQNANNSIRSAPSPYFNSSHVSLLIFRQKQKTEMTDLRHQRNCDVIFDFVERASDGEEMRPKEMYEIIETLLPGANYEEDNVLKPGRCLELWAAPCARARSGWTTVVDVARAPAAHVDETMVDAPATAEETARPWLQSDPDSEGGDSEREDADPPPSFLQQEEDIAMEVPASQCSTTQCVEPPPPYREECSDPPPPFRPDLA